MTQPLTGPVIVSDMSILHSKLILKEYVEESSIKKIFFSLKVNAPKVIQFMRAIPNTILFNRSHTVNVHSAASNHTTQKIHL